jgi:hypothetical protein
MKGAGQRIGLANAHQRPSAWLGEAAPNKQRAAGVRVSTPSLSRGLVDLGISKNQSSQRQKLAPNRFSNRAAIDACHALPSQKVEEQARQAGGKAALVLIFPCYSQLRGAKTGHYAYDIIDDFGSGGNHLLSQLMVR